MTALPPVDPEHNRDLIAARCGWPEDAADVCRELERDFPQWIVFWVSGTLKSSPKRGYQAVAQRHRSIARAFGETPEELREALEGASVNLLADPWAP